MRVVTHTVKVPSVQDIKDREESILQHYQKQCSDLELPTTGTLLEMQQRLNEHRKQVLGKAWVLLWSPGTWGDMSNLPGSEQLPDCSTALSGHVTHSDTQDWIGTPACKEGGVVLTSELPGLTSCEGNDPPVLPPGMMCEVRIPWSTIEELYKHGVAEGAIK